MKSIAFLAAMLPSLLAGSRTLAQQTPGPAAFIQPAVATTTYTIETVLEGLDRPCGLAIRPGWSKDVAAELFLVERGARRILKMATDHPGATQEVIVGFPAVDSASATIDGFPDEDLQDKAVPLGLLFLTHSKLAVCCLLKDGHQLLNVYRLPGTDSVLTADQTDHQVGPVSTGDFSKGELSAGAPPLAGGWPCGLAKTSDAVYVASGEASRGRILKASLEANRLTNLQTFIAMKKGTGLSGPAGMTVNPQPRLQYLVVGQMGRIDVPRDSRLAYYSPKSGRLALDITTGLHDLVGLSYSLAGGNLYGIDLAWLAESDGGVYRLDDAKLAGKPACRAIKIAAARRPTSMVFAPDGSLYVTAWDSAPAATKNQSDQKTGILLKITGEW